MTITTLTIAVAVEGTLLLAIIIAGLWAYCCLRRAGAFTPTSNLRTFIGDAEAIAARVTALLGQASQQAGPTGRDQGRAAGRDDVFAAAARLRVSGRNGSVPLDPIARSMQVGDDEHAPA